MNKATKHTIHFEPKPCAVCEGKGGWKWMEELNKWYQECPDCNGLGYYVTIHYQECQTCEGSGKITVKSEEDKARNK